MDTARDMQIDLTLDPSALHQYPMLMNGRRFVSTETQEAQEAGTHHVLACSRARHSLTNLGRLTDRTSL
jgi:hypothetical protein